MTISKSQKTFDNGHWLFPKQLDYENAFGFIYVIVDKLEPAFYIGKKNFRGNGKLNRGKQSNWRNYTSSSKLVNELLGLYGKESFDFIVLDQYYNRGSLPYAETWSQCVAEVPTNNHVTYNRFIDSVSWKVTEPITDLHKKRLLKVLKDVHGAYSKKQALLSKMSK